MAYDALGVIGAQVLKGAGWDPRGSDRGSERGCYVKKTEKDYSR